MIDWKILNFLNKQKYKKILLVVKNEQQVKRFIKNSNITILEEKNFLDHFPENAYHIISTWEILSEGTSMSIYTYLAKMNHNLRDDGFLYLRVLKNKSHLEESENIPFCWNAERVRSIGKAKALKQLDKEEYVNTKKESFIRFKYVPAI